MLKCSSLRRGGGKGKKKKEGLSASDKSKTLFLLLTAGKGKKEREAPSGLELHRFVRLPMPRQGKQTKKEETL